MEKVKIDRRISPSSTAATKILALLLVVCLAECATGSCLSYGHSCWGAHGKRSGTPPATAPDWYLTRLLRHMAATAELNRARQAAKNNDINAIFRVDMADDTPATNKFMSDTENSALDMGASRNPEAIPMLDDDLLSKMRIWKIMREDSEN